MSEILKSLGPIELDLVGRLALRRGVKFELGFDIVNADTGAVIPLTGYEIKATARPSRSLTATPAIYLGAELADPDNGVCRLYLSSSATEALDNGEYFYDVVLTAPGDDPDTWIEGRLEIRDNVTDPTP